MESVSSFGRRGLLLNTPFWNLSGRTSVGESILQCPGICFVFRREESFSYTPRAADCLVKRVGRFFYTSPVGICLVVRREGIISYTPRASMCLVWGWWGVSLTRPVMESLCSFGLIVRRVGSFSYTPRAGICLVVRQEGTLF